MLRSGSVLRLRSLVRCGWVAIPHLSSRTQQRRRCDTNPARVAAAFAGNFVRAENPGFRRTELIPGSSRNHRKSAASLSLKLYGEHQVCRGGLPIRHRRFEYPQRHGSFRLMLQKEWTRHRSCGPQVPLLINHRVDFHYAVGVQPFRPARNGRRGLRHNSRGNRFAAARRF